MGHTTSPHRISTPAEHQRAEKSQSKRGEEGEKNRTKTNAPRALAPARPRSHTSTSTRTHDRTSGVQASQQQITTHITSPKRVALFPRPSRPLNGSPVVIQAPSLSDFYHNIQDIHTKLRLFNPFVPVLVRPGARTSSQRPRFARWLAQISSFDPQMGKTRIVPSRGRIKGVSARFSPIMSIGMSRTWFFAPWDAHRKGFLCLNVRTRATGARAAKPSPLSPHPYPLWGYGAYGDTA